MFIVLGYHLHEMDFENVPDFSKRIKICSKGNACRMRFNWLSYHRSAERILLTFSVACLQRGRYERFFSDFALIPVIFLFGFLSCVQNALPIMQIGNFFTIDKLGKKIFQLFRAVRNLFVHLQFFPDVPR